MTGIPPALLCAFACLQAVPQAALGAERILTPGQRVEASVGDGEHHVYVTSLQAGEFLRLIVVAQYPLDVAVKVVTPAGGATEVDVATETLADEPASVLAETSGSYRIELTSKTVGRGPGSYTLESEAARPATEEDRSRLSAERALAEGVRLARESSAESAARGLMKIDEALRVWRALDDRRWQARALYLAGEIHHDQYDNEKAQERLNEAGALCRTAGDRRGEADALALAGRTYSYRGDTRRHLETAREVLAIWREVGDRAQVAKALVALAGAHANAGEPQEALDLFREAALLRRQLGDRIGEAEALQSSAILHDELGDPARTLAVLAETLPLWQALGDKGEESNAYNSMAGAYSTQGDSQKALEMYRRALEVAAPLGDAGGLGRGIVLSNIGYELNVLGSHEEARVSLEEGLLIARDVSSTGLEAAVLVNLGAAYTGLGRLGEASESLDRALALARERRDRTREARALERMARLAAAAGDFEQARTRAESALEVLESVRRELRSVVLRSSFVASVRAVYELYIDILMDLHAQRPTAGFDAQALNVSERARARAMLDVLAQPGMEAVQADPALLAEERALQDRLTAALDRQMRLGKDAPRDRAEAAAREVQALTTEWEAAKTRITAANPRYVDLKQSAPLTATQIQGDVLDDDMVMLEYALGRKRSFLWVVTRTSLRAYELPGRTAVEDAARAAYAGLARAEPRGETKAPDADPLAALGRMLLAPVAGALGGKRVLVVPDGALHYIPFAALPDPRGTGPLIASQEVVTAPSASVVAQLRRAQAHRRPAPKTVALLADPVFDRRDERLRGKAQSGANAQPAAAAHRNQLRAIEDSGLPGGLPRLLFTRREAQAILKLVAPAQGRASLDFDASRATVNDASLADFRIVHFATHGFFNAAHPDLSGIVLSLVDREGRDARGFFSTADVFNMKLGADLVVLSACRTALGRDIYGEGIVGLSRGFMYAGAPRLVASLWTVDDAATAALMTEFYRGVLVRGLRPAAALQAAQRELMRGGRFRDPFYWAAFQLQGEWR